MNGPHKWGEDSALYPAELKMQKVFTIVPGF